MITKSVSLALIIWCLLIAILNVQAKSHGHSGGHGHSGSHGRSHSRGHSGSHGHSFFSFGHSSGGHHSSHPSHTSHTSHSSHSDHSSHSSNGHSSGGGFFGWFKSLFSSGSKFRTPSHPPPSTSYGHIGPVLLGVEASANSKKGLSSSGSSSSSIHSHGSLSSLSGIDTHPFRQSHDSTHASELPHKPSAPISPHIGWKITPNAANGPGSRTSQTSQTLHVSINKSGKCRINKISFHFV